MNKYRKLGILNIAIQIMGTVIFFAGYFSKNEWFILEGLLFVMCSYIVISIAETNEKLDEVHDELLRNKKV